MQLMFNLNIPRDIYYSRSTVNVTCTNIYKIIYK